MTSSAATSIAPSPSIRSSLSSRARTRLFRVLKAYSLHDLEVRPWVHPLQVGQAVSLCV